MRIANLNGRLHILTADGGIDVESASKGVFSADPQAIYARWREFRDWATGAELTATVAVDLNALGPPAPRPPQVLAVGLNYREHAIEAGLDIPDEPVVFTKFPSCLTGPASDVAVEPGSWTDWEVELVAVISQRAEHVPAEDAWNYVAGLTVGQDISDRLLQFRGPQPQQFDLGKSRPGFGPTGPWIVTPDELSDPDDLTITCTLDDEQMQKASTKDMIFSIPQIVARLSTILPLLPGDVIFTGTPAGIGATMNPPRWLTPGQTLTSHVEGIGEMHNHIVSTSAHSPARSP
ncbi:fumarylacetoacetate hydrolase family protein [Mycolicibacterium komossense]|uniref:Fumarylacetoacetate hydrolase family protein n=1 Tax=Mycolicibacterium komossense TaxID=1779 RepID=A0ABT3CF68_9MYCO|nr:fumarylacetoacetate hydrolase family protein [Mycolicibacterium komossense]MCV7228042.1 fumarylacetoacetate hydrolase family protein [Mycolicibacterium komossense]